MAKHFWKTVIIFAVMILIGMIGVVLVSNIDINGESAGVLKSQSQVAK